MYLGRHGSLDRLLVQGRWASSKTARIYINEDLAVLAELKLTFNAPAKAYARQYNNLVLLFGILDFFFALWKGWCHLP